MAVSPYFKMFALATLDGRVTVYSLRSGKKVSSVPFQKEVLELIATPKLGFIVVFMEGEVTLMNVNGDVMKNVVFEKVVKKVFTFASEHDLDFVIVQTMDNELGFFEAFYPENFVLFASVQEEVVWAVHSAAITSFLVVTRTGSLRVIPQALRINQLRVFAV
jgi:hypothetical protein